MSDSHEAFAKKFNLGRDAVGKRMGDSGGTGTLDLEIVGLVQDANSAEGRQCRKRERGRRIRK
jgi:hypothetical protein